MKRSYRSFAAALLAGGLTVGAIVAAQSPNPDFDATVSKLDPGGSFYLYVDLENALLKQVDLFEALLSEGDAPQLAMFAPIARAVIQSLGLDQLDDLGVSVTSLGGPINRQKVFLRLVEPAGVFRLFGGEPYALKSLSILPADAVLASAQTFDQSGIIPLAQQTAAAVSGTAGQAQVDAVFQTLGNRIGINIPQFLASLGPESAFYLRLDEQKTVSIPLGTAVSSPFQTAPAESSLTLPTPHFVFLMETRDISPYMSILAALSKHGATIVSAPAPGMEITEIAVKDNPFELKPVLAYRENWLYFASDRAELDKALETAAGGANILASPEAQALGLDIPGALNGFSFLSPRLPRMINDVLNQLAQADPNATRWSVMLMNQFGGVSQDSPGRVSVRVNQPDGILWTTQGDVRASQLAQGMMAAPAGVLAAIAVPNFLEAQTRSKVARTKADMRSMATALEAYFVDWNQYPPSADWDTLMAEGPGGVGNMKALGQLTSPIAYITRAPLDPFQQTGGTYHYYNFKSNANEAATQSGYAWVLFSPGPDMQLNWKSLDNLTWPGALDLIFDPTNGTVSSGDLARTNKGDWSSPGVVAAPQ